jgi:hypothetical protein
VRLALSGDILKTDLLLFLRVFVTRKGCQISKVYEENLPEMRNAVMFKYLFDPPVIR